MDAPVRMRPNRLPFGEYQCSKSVTESAPMGWLREVPESRALPSSCSYSEHSPPADRSRLPGVQHLVPYARVARYAPLLGESMRGAAIGLELGIPWAAPGQSSPTICPLAGYVGTSWSVTSPGPCGHFLLYPLDLSLSVVNFILLMPSAPQNQREGTRPRSPGGKPGAMRIHPHPSTLD